ncbi:PAS/PAC sensor hybrid histidine kinase [Candidatus Magnetomorum sp. HK-1]|nr:PAS/PAC sensor hybrid histidine kinase [Candidatus Magnetomorum sp. HK-1]
MINKQKVNILIVDDQKKNLLALEAILKDENFRLITALSSREALTYLLEEEIALLLLDVQMPVMDGFQLAQMIRSRKKTSDIPIIFLSAEYTDDAHLLKGYEFKAVDYILKPFNESVLKSKIQVLVDLYQQKIQLKNLVEKLQYEVDMRSNAEKLLLQQKNELIQTHQSLKNANNYNQHLFDHAPIGYIVLNKEGLILNSNKKLTNFLDTNNESIKDLYLKSFLSSEYYQDFTEKWENLINQKKSVNIECELLKNDETRLWVRIDLERTSFLQDNNDMILGTILDITLQRRTEKILREKQAQLAHAGRLVSLGEMSTGVAHELNQPLSIIQLSVEGLNLILKKKPDSKKLIEKFKQEFKSILEEIERASEIINNMRAYARSDNYDTETDLVECINRSLSFFKEQFRQKEIQLNVIIDSNVPSVLFRPRKFEQIIVNLLSNASYAVNYKYQQVKDGKIEVKDNIYQKIIEISLQYNQDKKVIIFIVSDNGIGMDEKEISCCMDAFFTTKDVGQGTGLGLSIVNGILNDFKCQIEIKSNKNEGTIITINIPFINI